MNYIETAYIVRFTASNDSTAIVDKLFNERWQAESFRDSCTDNMNAVVVVLYEKDVR